MMRLLALCIAAAAPAGAGGGVSRALCLEGDAVVSGGDMADLALTCEAVGLALDLLSACGLQQRRPVGIEIVREVEVAGATDCLGSYDGRDDGIEVVGPAWLDGVVSAENPFAAIGAAEHYRSLVVHEMAHAVFAQNAGPRTLAGPEYVAYAMQYAALPEAARNRVLAGFGEIGEVGPRELDETVAAMAPLRFGAKAWTHFAAPGNGCAVIRDLVRGSADPGRTRPKADPPGACHEGPRRGAAAGAAAGSQPTMSRPAKK